MSTVDCETSEEYFYDSEQSLASEVSEDSFHSANEVRTDVRFQLSDNLVNKLKSFFFSPYYLSYLAGVKT